MAHHADRVDQLIDALGWLLILLSLLPVWLS